MLALRLPSEIDVRLERLAARTGRTKSYYARQAILAYIDEIEERYRGDSVVKDWENSDQKNVSPPDSYLGHPNRNAAQRQAAMQEIRDLLSDVDGNGIDLDQIRNDRRTARFERND